MPFRYCEHIKTDGIQCHSPAMGDGRWCYYHGLYRRRMRSFVDKDLDMKNLARQSLGLPPLTATEQHRQQFVLGPIEDASSVQVALSTVINALASNRMDRNRATALLYGLQLAANNLRGIVTSEPEAAAPTLSESFDPAHDFFPPRPRDPNYNPEINDVPAPSATSSTAGTYAQVPAYQELIEYLGTGAPSNEQLEQEIRREGDRRRDAGQPWPTREEEHELRQQLGSRSEYDAQHDGTHGTLERPDSHTPATRATPPHTAGDADNGLPLADAA